jgi:hypothetical protein
MGWFLFWNIKHKGFAQKFSSISATLPLSSIQKKQYQAFAHIIDYFSRADNKEKTFIILFQNNLELRPGGGFIGSFGVVKIANKKISSIQTYDLSNFDSNIPNTIPAPYPIAETGMAKYWKMRDSNFSPDFSINAKKAEEFYYLGGGKEKIDGVIGMTSNVLTSILKITGPISMPGYPGKYDSENAVLSLEYQVEKAFENQGINRTERKSVMSDLANEIKKRVTAFSLSQKIQLVGVIITDLAKKDIQIYFSTKEMQQAATDINWAGRVDSNWKKDFFMLVDANLGSFKSDYYVSRSVEYSVDLSGEVPRATVKVTYHHAAKQKDWMTRDYTDYVRIYVPEGAQLQNNENFDDIQFGSEFGKKYFGSIVRVPIGQAKTVSISYILPTSFKDDYNLKIQKQAGVNSIPYLFTIKKTAKITDHFSKNITKDFVIY